MFVKETKVKLSEDKYPVILREIANHGHEYPNEKTLREMVRWIDSLDLWRNWVKEGEIIQKGFIAMAEKPGLGVEMNEDGARKAQVPGTPWFEPTRRG